MCRFHDNQDRGYQHILASLEELVEQGQLFIARRSMHLSGKSPVSATYNSRSSHLSEHYSIGDSECHGEQVPLHLPQSKVPYGRSIWKAIPPQWSPFMIFENDQEVRNERAEFEMNIGADERSNIHTQVEVRTNGPASAPVSMPTTKIGHISAPYEQKEVLALFVESLSMQFHRTIRILDNGRAHNLPPSLGYFPLYSVPKFASSLPQDMVEKGGLFLPMYRKSIHFKSFPAVLMVVARKGSSVDILP